MTRQAKREHRRLVESSSVLHGGWELRPGILGAETRERERESKEIVIPVIR